MVVKPNSAKPHSTNESAIRTRVEANLADSISASINENQLLSRHSESSFENRAVALNASVGPIEPLSEFSQFNIFAAIGTGEEVSVTENISSQPPLSRMPSWSISIVALAGISSWVWAKSRKEDQKGNRALGNIHSANRAIQCVGLDEPTVRAAYQWAN